jgi:hypothetical protein
MRTRWILLLIILLSVPAAAVMPIKGLLLQPLQDAKGRIEPGLVVQFAPSGKVTGAIIVTVLGRTFPAVPPGQVMPFQPDAAMSWALLRLDETAGSGGSLYILVKNLLAAVPAHPLREEVIFQWAEAAAGCSRRPDGGVTRDQALTAIRQYQREYPRGAHRDEAEWTLCRLEAEPLEYEGNVPLMEAAVRAFERYLWEHTKTPLRPEIRLRIARLCRLAGETVEDRLKKEASGRIPFPTTDKKSVTYTRADAESFVEKAKMIYRELLSGTPPRVQAEARLALFNLAQGRRLSGAPADW